jgi:hypothetical protein
MAKNTNADIDQTKVAENAEKIARGDAPKPDSNTQAGDETPTVLTPGPDSIPAAPEATSNTKPQESAGDQLADKLKQNRQQPITQGAPGALKPGTTAATNKPVERISEDEAEQQQHEALVGQYGPEYVTARKGNEDRQFSRRSWELLGPAKADGSKDGWKPTVKVPAEVKALKSKKQEGAGNE